VVLLYEETHVGDLPNINMYALGKNMEKDVGVLLPGE
jgi:hypothetical protein